MKKGINISMKMECSKENKKKENLQKNEKNKQKCQIREKRKIEINQLK